jgi:hypothetical protein
MAPTRGMAGLDDLAHGDTMSAPKSLAAGGKRPSTVPFAHAIRLLCRSGGGSYES